MVFPEKSHMSGGRSSPVDRGRLPPFKLLPGVGFLVFFFVVPLALLLVMSFWRASFGGVEIDWTLANYERLVSRPIYLQLMLKSTRIAFTATALTIVVAFPFAYWVAGKPPRQRAQLVFLVLIPFWTSYRGAHVRLDPAARQQRRDQLCAAEARHHRPTTRHLPVQPVRGDLGLLYVYLPYAILPILLSLERLDRNLLYAAADLGRHALVQQLWRIIVPLSCPGILGAAILVFILSISAYVTPALLGGASGVMIANVIPDLFGVGMNWPLGATVSLLLIAVTIAWIWLIGARVGLGRIFMEG